MYGWVGGCEFPETQSTGNGKLPMVPAEGSREKTEITFPHRRRHLWEAALQMAPLPSTCMGCSLFGKASQWALGSLPE